MTPSGKKEVFSSFDIAQICKTDIASVQKWVETGELPSFKVPGNHTRVHLRDLEKFLKAKGVTEPDSWKNGMERFRVLLVEDEIDLLEIVADFLREDPKLEIQTESTGFGAALKIAHWHPDVILLDFVMPGMDGFEVCKKLKNDPQTLDIPIIAITSLSSPENRDTVLKSGVSAFVGKPFQSDKLLQAIRQILGISSED